jgi:ATP-dependent DNA ligase
VNAIPQGEEWIYEPKWDGFRCLAFRSGETIVLQSKSGQPLGRYFPELVQALSQIEAEKFVLDGEIVIEHDDHLDFDALLQRIHPAESRIKRLSTETPCTYLWFDLLVTADGQSITASPLSERKTALKRFFADHVSGRAKKALRLSPYSADHAQAQAWITGLAAYGFDGVVAKLDNEPYHSGDRDAMQKIKRMRTADCVVGGFRYATKKENGVGSILLGLYNKRGELDHVGFCSSFPADERKVLVKRLERLIEPPGFTGKAPGGPSRWTRNNQRSTEWQPLRPELVCEVQYDHFSGGRFRHGTKLLRWRPDKTPRSCTIDQLKPAGKQQKLAS